MQCDAMHMISLKFTVLWICCFAPPYD